MNRFAIGQPNMAPLLDEPLRDGVLLIQGEDTIPANAPLKKSRGVYLFEGIPFTGKRLYYSQHKLNSITEYESGKIVKITTMWLDTSVVQSSKVFSGGCDDGSCLEGTLTFWYRNGQMQKVENYHKGLKHGKWECWDQLGNKISEGWYKRGKAVGKHQYWYSDGTPKRAMEYVTWRVSIETIYDFEGKVWAEKVHQKNLSLRLLLPPLKTTLLNPDCEGGLYGSLEYKGWGACFGNPSFFKGLRISFVDNSIFGKKLTGLNLVVLKLPGKAPVTGPPVSGAVFGGGHYPSIKVHGINISLFNILSRPSPTKGLLVSGFTYLGNYWHLLHVSLETKKRTIAFFGIHNRGPSFGLYYYRSADPENGRPEKERSISLIYRAEWVDEIKGDNSARALIKIKIKEQ